MISLASGLPILQVGERGISEYSPEWLETSVRAAAERAGHDEWWFASDIVRSLFVYLRDRFNATVITVGELFEKLRLTLSALGFQDIAGQLRDQVPPFKISLIRMANEAAKGGSYELSFFQRLGRQVDEAVQTGATVVHATGIKAAVRKLRGARRWTTRCDVLQEEIMGFVRQRAKQREGITLHVV